MHTLCHLARLGNSDFLGIYMDVRDKVPSAPIQAAMALRYHVREGNLKWVSLLLWAGADPRLAVPDLERKPAKEFMGTALVVLRDLAASTPRKPEVRVSRR